MGCRYLVAELGEDLLGFDMVLLQDRHRIIHQFSFDVLNGVRGPSKIAADTGRDNAGDMATGYRCWRRGSAELRYPHPGLIKR